MLIVFARVCVAYAWGHHAHDRVFCMRFRLSLGRLRPRVATRSCGLAIVVGGGSGFSAPPMPANSDMFINLWIERVYVWPFAKVAIIYNNNNHIIITQFASKKTHAAPLPFEPIAKPPQTRQWWSSIFCLCSGMYLFIYEYYAIIDFLPCEPPQAPSSYPTKHHQPSM